MRRVQRGFGRNLTLRIFGGVESLGSGGILDLTDEGLGDIRVAGGVLTLAFFEGFDDVATSIDATWSGTLSRTLIPSPGVLALPGLARGQAISIPIVCSETMRS